MKSRLGELAKKAINALAAGIVAVILLSIFCIGYLNTGVHIKNQSGATDYKWKEKQLKSTMVEGFAWIKMDEHGFNNNFFIKGNVDILLMGSSHMEAYNVASNKNTGYLLNEILPEYYTYNIGTSGHNIYNCANNIRAAVEEYSPTEYVVIETDRIDLDVEAMQSVVSGNYPHIKSYDSGLLFLIQQYFPLAKNVYKQLADWWSADNSILNNQEVDLAINIDEEEYETSLDRFLSFIRAGGGDCKVIIVYQSPTVLNPDGTLKKPCDDDKLDIFSQLCEKNDIIFVDTASDFELLYTKEHILAHGFTNTAVGVGHLNEYGHRTVAEKIAKAIKEVQ